MKWLKSICCIFLCSFVIGCTEEEELIFSMSPGQISNIKELTFTVGDGVYNLMARARNVDAPYMEIAIVEIEPDGPFVTVHYKILVSEAAKPGAVYKSEIILSYYEVLPGFPDPVQRETRETIRVTVKGI